MGRELGDLVAAFESDFDLRDFARPSTAATVKRTAVTESRSIGLSKSVVRTLHFSATRPEPLLDQRPIVTVDTPC
jgi:hypothetical protein